MKLSLVPWRWEPARARMWMCVFACLQTWNMGSLQALEPELLGDSKGTL